MEFKYVNGARLQFSTHQASINTKSIYRKAGMFYIFQKYQRALEVPYSCHDATLLS